MKEGSHYSKQEAGDGHLAGAVNLGQGTWPAGEDSAKS